MQCIQKHLRYIGQNIGKLSTESAEECACACKDEDMCSFFSWTKKNKKCLMKSAIGKRKRKHGVFSGSVDCCRTRSMNHIERITKKPHIGAAALQKNGN